MRCGSAARPWRRGSPARGRRSAGEASPGMAGAAGREREMGESREGAAPPAAVARAPLATGEGGKGARRLERELTPLTCANTRWTPRWRCYVGKKMVQWCYGPVVHDSIRLGTQKCIFKVDGPI